MQIPCYRADIMHDWDLFEDVAIAFGYDRIISQPPPTYRWKTMPCWSGQTASEVLWPWIPRSDAVYPHGEEVIIRSAKHPGSSVCCTDAIENTIVRTDLIPLLLEFLAMNRHREMPVSSLWGRCAPLHHPQRLRVSNSS